jgi:hypothetical protein
MQFRYWPATTLPDGIASEPVHDPSPLRGNSQSATRYYKRESHAAPAQAAGARDIIQPFRNHRRAWPARATSSTASPPGWHCFSHAMRGPPGRLTSLKRGAAPMRHPLEPISWPLGRVLRSWGSGPPPQRGADRVRRPSCAAERVARHGRVWRSAAV